MEDGFYYDFSFQRPFTPEDLAAIENRMREIAKRDLPVERQMMPREEAVKFFRDLGERYKAEIIAAIPEGEQISLYRQDGFVDLPRPARALSRQAQGVQADESCGRLLARRLEERDAAAHLRHGLDAEGGSGCLPAAAGGSGEARSPQVGHAASTFPHAGRGAGDGVLAPKRVDDLAAGRTVHAPGAARQRLSRGALPSDPRPQPVGEVGSLAELQGADVHHGVGEARLRDQADELPGHLQIYNKGLHSYRDLPLRLAEFGACHRNEPSGALHGIMRIRGFTQDDGHIFCTEEQSSRSDGVQRAAQARLHRFRIRPRYWCKLATRPAKRVGPMSSGTRRSGPALALEDAGLPFQVLPGEGAFYGPKIEFTSRTCWPLLAVWHHAARFLHAGKIGGGVNRGGQRPPRAGDAAPRSILGSMERFIGILIEHYARALPVARARANRGHEHYGAPIKLCGGSDRRAETPVCGLKPT